MTFNCNDEWESFCTDSFDITTCELNKKQFYPINESTNTFPKCSQIYISTTTKISYLSKNIDIFDVFWKIPIISYTTLSCGAIKKQIKYSFKSKEEYELLDKMLKKYSIYNVQQITYLNNPDKNIYKDTRKINIGLCDKDVTSLRSKKKSAFYNCFVLILRIFDDELDKYREAHIKVFNTGKLELPGIKCKKYHMIILNTLVDILNKHCNINVSFLDNHETVLINSNFTCGYCLNREKLANILKLKYNIETAYDPCSYPGIMSKIYLNNSKNKLSFMIFRTGSVLIVGKCNETDIYNIYEKLKQIFHDEFNFISVDNNFNQNIENKKSKSKGLKKYKTIIRE
tara:strand:+ start:1293 stop:2318 length:1026 start_codon:yes stop_codon:yes gene_type:complete